MLIIANKAQYTYLSQDFYMLSLKCCTYVLGGGGGGATIFSFDKSTSLEGGSENDQMIRWDFQKMKGKNKKLS